MHDTALNIIHHVDQFSVNTVRSFRENLAEIHLENWKIHATSHETNIVGVSRCNFEDRTTVMGIILTPTIITIIILTPTTIITIIITIKQKDTTSRS